VGIRNRRRPTPTGGVLNGQVVERLHTEIRQRDDTIQLLLEESFADLQNYLYEPGWLRLTAQFEQEFTTDGLLQIRAACRLMAQASPLIKRALSLRCAYVWGQGAEITARANGRRKREQDVQAVVAKFLNEPANARAFTGPAAQQRLERCLGTDGEFFAVLFTRPTTGEVSVRVVVADEIVDIIANPDDRSEPWYYKRRWVQRTIDPATGAARDEQVEQLHPDLDYRPKNRPASFGRLRVAWDAPMLHVKVGDLEGWTRGVPDAYAAIDWARAYRTFLEDWARLVKSLSRFAWRLTTPGSKRAAVKTKLATAPARDSYTGEPLGVGATAIMPADQTLEAIPKSGATIDSDSGKPLAAMVAAALDVPLTMLLADPGQTGARAVAETLDQPTELAMGMRRQLWAGVYQRILAQVIVESVRAPEGALKGTVDVDDRGRETVRLRGGTDTTIDISFPDLDSDTSEVIKSVVEASSTGVLPPEHVARLLLTALGISAVDEIVEAMTDPDTGEFIWPGGPTLSRNPDAPTGFAPAEPGDTSSSPADDSTAGDDEES